MTDQRTSSVHSKKLRSALVVLALFSGSILGGMIFAYITSPKEACAQCVQLYSKTGCIERGGTSTGGWQPFPSECQPGEYVAGIISYGGCSGGICGENVLCCR